MLSFVAFSFLNVTLPVNTPLTAGVPLNKGVPITSNDITFLCISGLYRFLNSSNSIIPS